MEGHLSDLSFFDGLELPPPKPVEVLAAEGEQWAIDELKRRKREPIKARLAAIDTESIRPQRALLDRILLTQERERLRSKVSKSQADTERLATLDKMLAVDPDEDESRIKALEAEAETLREELRRLV